MSETEKRKPKRRQPRKPVLNDSGELVTPISGQPAAPINWAPSCKSCKSRTCEDCGTETIHFASSCKRCGGKSLSEPHPCPDTVSTGTKETSVGTRQRVKCRCCGAGFSWTVEPKT